MFAYVASLMIGTLTSNYVLEKHLSAERYRIKVESISEKVRSRIAYHKNLDETDEIVWRPIIPFLYESERKELSDLVQE